MSYKGDLVSRRDAIEAIEKAKMAQTPDGELYVAKYNAEMNIQLLPSAQPERDIPKRVSWTGWKGCRDTRYRCPSCKKPVRNTDVYCHRCGQKLMFPHISFTDYVPGEKQQTIVRWDDDNNGIDRNPSTE